MSLDSVYTVLDYGLETSTSLGSVCTVLEHRLDDHIFSKCMYDIGAGIDGHVSW